MNGLSRTIAETTFGGGAAIATEELGARAPADFDSPVAARTLACLRAWESVGLKRPRSLSVDGYFARLAEVLDEPPAEIFRGRGDDARAVGRIYALARFGGDRSTDASMHASACERLEAAALRALDAGEIDELRNAWSVRCGSPAEVRPETTCDANAPSPPSDATPSPEKPAWTASVRRSVRSGFATLRRRVRPRHAALAFLSLACVGVTSGYHFRDWLEGPFSPLLAWDRAVVGSSPSTANDRLPTNVSATAVTLDQFAGSGLPRLMEGEDAYARTHNDVVVDSWTKLAEEYESVGLVDRADAILCRLVKLRPHDAELQRAYARFLLSPRHESIRDPHRALTFAERAYSLDEGDDRNVDTLITALFASGHVARAVELQSLRLEASAGGATTS